MANSTVVKNIYPVLKDLHLNDFQNAKSSNSSRDSDITKNHVDSSGDESIKSIIKKSTHNDVKETAAIASTDSSFGDMKMITEMRTENEKPLSKYNSLRDSQDEFPNSSNSSPDNVKSSQSSDSDVTKNLDLIFDLRF